MQVVRGHRTTKQLHSRWSHRKPNSCRSWKSPWLSLVAAAPRFDLWACCAGRRLPTSMVFGHGKKAPEKPWGFDPAFSICYPCISMFSFANGSFLGISCLSHTLQSMGFSVLFLTIRDFRRSFEVLCFRITKTSIFFISLPCFQWAS